MKRIAALLTVLFALSACDVPTTPVNEPQKDLGDFVLGHNIVVTPDIQKGPFSRDADPEVWKASVKSAIDARLGRYEGDRLVHLGVNVSGYVLAYGGVPLLYSPKSALILTVTAWDDRAGGKFNDEAKDIIVLETFTGGSLVGSGYTLDAEEQMANLSYNAARAIEKWLAENAACLVDDVPAEVLAKCWVDNRDEERRRQLDQR